VSGLSVSPEAEERRCQEEGCRVPHHLVDAESGYCFSHDPARENDRRAARLRAGEATAKRNRKNPIPVDLGRLETPADFARARKEVLRGLARGDLTSTRANTLHRVLDGLRKDYELVELVARIDRMEAESRQRGMGVVR
jgi:hypothetical protein